MYSSGTSRVMATIEATDRAARLAWKHSARSHRASRNSSAGAACENVSSKKAQRGWG